MAFQSKAHCPLVDRKLGGGYPGPPSRGGYPGPPSSRSFLQSFPAGPSGEGGYPGPLSSRSFQQSFPAGPSGGGGATEHKVARYCIKMDRSNLKKMFSVWSRGAS